MWKTTEHVTRRHEDVHEIGDFSSYSQTTAEERISHKISNPKYSNLRLINIKHWLVTGPPMTSIINNYKTVINVMSGFFSTLHFDTSGLNKLQ